MLTIVILICIIISISLIKSYMEYDNIDSDDILFSLIIGIVGGIVSGFILGIIIGTTYDTTYKKILLKKDMYNSYLYMDLQAKRKFRIITHEDDTIELYNSDIKIICESDTTDAYVIIVNKIVNYDYLHSYFGLGFYGTDYIIEIPYNTTNIKK